MTTKLLATMGAVVLMMTPGMAVEPTRELVPKEAARIVALRANVPVDRIEVAFILDGSVRTDSMFEAKNVRRVATILPIRTGNGTGERREMEFYDFYWNESLGWFTWAKRQERSGEVVYIWSQLRGIIVNR